MNKYSIVSFLVFSLFLINVIESNKAALKTTTSTKETFVAHDACIDTWNPAFRSTCYRTRTVVPNNLCCYIWGNGIRKCAPVNFNNRYSSTFKSQRDGLLYNQDCSSKKMLPTIFTALLTIIIFFL
jgi:hypothetical protein